MSDIRAELSALSMAYISARPGEEKEQAARSLERKILAVLDAPKNTDQTRALSLWRTIYSSSGSGQTISTRPAAFAAAKELDALLGGGAQQAQEDRGHG